jgi:Family of unknown function (DUF5677)
VVERWAANLRPYLVEVVNDRSLAHHQHAAAVHLLRLQNLCRAIRSLGLERLHHEAASLVRVTVELAANAAWIATDDLRAWRFAQDAEFYANRKEKNWKEHLGVDMPARENLTEPKKLPTFAERVKEVGGDVERLVAATYSWSSEPTHGAFCVLGYLEEDEIAMYGRVAAAFGVQAAFHLAGIPERYLPKRPDISELRQAKKEWTAAR